MGYRVENLKANTQYEYRIQCKSGASNERSEWSQSLLASTKPEPMSGETVFKAIGVPGKDQLEKLLNILYVIQMNQKFSYTIFFSPRGPGHPLLEHADKDGNLPLMHACAKLDLTFVEYLLSY